MERLDFSKQQIELLEGKSNWTTWKFRALILLRGIKKAVDVIEGRLMPPEPLAAEATDVQRKTFEKELEIFSTAEAMALHVLTSNMSREILLMVMRFTTAREMWLELNRLFDGGDSEEKLYRIGMDFFSSAPIEDKDMAVHLSHLKHQFYELNAEFEKNKLQRLPDILLIMKILNTLPDQYLPFLTSWQMVNKTDRTVERLTNELCLVQQQMQKSDKTQLRGEYSEALSVQKAHQSNFKHKGKQSSYKKKKDVCFYCKGKGHYISQCAKWIADGRPSKSQQQQHKSTASCSGSMQCNETLSVELMMVDSDIFAVESDKDAWYIDNGATNHVTNRRDIFRTFECFQTQVEIRTANGDKAQAIGSGTVHIMTSVNGRWQQKTLTNVWYVPKITKNLFSVLAAHDKNENSQFVSEPTSCSLMINGKQVLFGARQIGSGLFKIALKVVVPECAAEINVLSSEAMLQLYHERMGHQNKRHVKDVMQEEFDIKVNVNNETCEACMYGKAHRLKFGTRERATAPGELIHADVCGPFEMPSAKGYRYFVLFKDDFTRYRYIFFLKDKSEVAAKLEQMLAETKTIGHTVKEFLSDNGLEFNNDSVRQILSRYGIRHRLVCPYTAQQNGCAERDNRTIVETARTLLYAHDGLPKLLWAEMVNTAAYILNRTGVSSVDKVSPFELWLGKKPGIKHLRVIGTTCYVHVPDQKRRKLDKKALKCVLIGYDGDDNYRVWNRESNTVWRSRDVRFEQEKLLSPTGTGEIPVTLEPLSAGETEQKDVTADRNETISDSDDEMSSTDDVDIPEGRQLRDRTLIGRPTRLQDYVMSAELFFRQEPETYTEAVDSNQHAEWQEAMNSEICSLNENETWTLEQLPSGRKAIPCKWVYKIKQNPDGSVERYKARLVIKGCSQRKGVDYGQTFSPVVRASSIRALISIAASQKMVLTQFDVSTAFLYGELEEEIYMEQPEGFNDGSGRVCRLKRSLYGLKQAPRCWNKRFGNFLRQHRFEQNEADPCIFMRCRGKEKVIIALWVDDGIAAATSEAESMQLITELKSEFKIKAQEASYFLGLEIKTQQDGTIKVGQEGYTKRILERFGMGECRSTPTPAVKESGKAVLPDEESNLVHESFSYRSAVGALLYLATGTRPDIAHAVGLVSRNLEKPSHEDFIKVKRIFRYLQGTTDHGLVYRPGYKPGVIENYSDADHGGDFQTGRSTTGVVCLHAGAAISWLSQRQSSVAISTTEAEIVAASEAAREVVWLRRLMETMIPMNHVPELYVDNEAAVKLAHNPEFHRRTKHIRIRHFYVRERVSDGELEVKRVPTEFQLADMMTKPLHKPRLNALCDRIGLA